MSFVTKKKDRNLLVGLDIGTSKVVTMVAEANENNEPIQVVGVGVQPSRGLKKGVIVNIDATCESIQKAVQDAELMAGCKINSVCVGIAGSHIHSFNSNGVVAIRDREVDHGDVSRVIDAAKAVAIPNDQKVLHILPQEFVIDTQEGIKEPVGMSGVRLEARVHMVSGSIAAAQNIVKCIRYCGLEVSDLVLEQLASSYSVLTEDEKELGVCLVDIGAGTADITVFMNNSIVHTANIAIAGSQVTSDIAHALRTPTQYAEAIKIQHGSALARLINAEDTIEVKSVSDRPARRFALKSLAHVVEARYEELFALIYQNIQEHGLTDKIASGFVLTGGSSKMRGAVELAEEVFQQPVRLGLPDDVAGLSDVVCNPIHSTGVGLLHYIRQQGARGNAQSSLPLKSDAPHVWAKMKSWFARHF